MTGEVLSIRPRPDRRPRTVALLLVGLCLGAAAMVSALPHGPAGTSGALFGTAATGPCNPSNPSPSALLIPATNPSTSIKSGGSLGITYAIAIQSPTTSGVSAKVTVPSVTASFPESSGGSVQVFSAGTTLSISGSGWSHAGTVTKTKSISTALSFSSTKSASLSTQKIALMANASYGTLTLEVRWHWTEHASNSSGPTNGSWTVPNNTSNSSTLPSLFYPAPYVSILSTSPTTAPAGTNISLKLGGAVANTSFRIVVEYPNNGTEITSVWHSSPSGATTFNVTAPLSYASGTPLPAGKYLIHVHDACEAITHSLSVTATTASGGGGSGGPGVPRGPGRP